LTARIAKTQNGRVKIDQLNLGTAGWRAGFATVLFAALLSATPGYSFSALFAFGDSLSDTGRNPAPVENYYNGRYSNGPLWVEYLSGELGFAYNASNNFAVAGSTTANLATQVAGVAASPDLARALFTVWCGGNDFIDNASLGLNETAWNAVISSAVMNLTNAASGLYAKGAREILVGNLPDIAQIPAAASLPEIYQTFLGEQVASLNTQLGAALAIVGHNSPGLRIYSADFYTLFNEMYTAPASYGFTVATIDALDDTTLTNKSFTGPGQYYVFWDLIHPTTKSHALIAQAALQVAGVQMELTGSGGNASLLLGHLSPSISYTIQTSLDLKAWTNYQTITATGTNATVVLTNGLAGAGFYRVAY
jgi:phospholipase/lecithinase/hemolysin